MDISSAILDPELGRSAFTVEKEVTKTMIMASLNFVQEPRDLRVLYVP